MKDLTINSYTFQELTNNQLYELLQLRSDIFVVEQECIFLDLDGKDQEAHHIIGTINNKIVAYTRLFHRDIMYHGYTSIGRVAIHQDFRGEKFGHVLMQKSIEILYNLYGDLSIKIGAQEHLEKFYNHHGFQKIDQKYLEDGIWHIYMIK
jgi:ElaA protein